MFKKAYNRIAVKPQNEETYNINKKSSSTTKDVPEDLFYHISPLKL
jgi:hypothetical protein